ncbi:DUF3027 domain-containing protein [Demequina aurantiaca]|uniref:DUF3027 domain-containing protein n=1 Tax=Demequina aurantiaca TaxID=676200 RepID=UPI0009FF5BD7|nr:DUF3027 domain-containing protein [Demequina aurantiaca]
MDTVLDQAIDIAREAAVETANDDAAVGVHVGSAKAGERLVTHLFACTLQGYHGWVWSVTLARAPRAKTVTVCESELIPTDDALLAPAWIPWADRVQPGDLDASMMLPFVKEDPRLVPGYEATGDVDADALAIFEFGLGRERVLGPEGREDVAQRWARGSHGKTAPSAIASAAPCSTCAFFVPLTGSLRMAFGACTNEWSQSDGRVVAVDHGCGAHSQTDVERQQSQWPETDPVFENDVPVAFDLTTPDPEPKADATDAPSADAVAEPAAEATQDAAESATETVAVTGTEPVAETVADAATETPADATPAISEVAPETSAEPDAR